MRRLESERTAFAAAAAEAAVATTEAAAAAAATEAATAAATAAGKGSSCRRLAQALDDLTQLFYHIDFNLKMQNRFLLGS